MPEPDWKTELRSELLAFTDYGEGQMDDLMRSVLPHVNAAYERGLQAGRSQGRYTTGRKKWRKEEPWPTAGAGAAGPTPASTTEGDEP